MIWPTKKLGSVIEFNYGKGITRHDRKDDGDYPIYGANGVLDRTNRYLVDAEAIIVGRKGSAGEVTRVSGKFWPSDVTYYVLGNKTVDIDYIFYLLKQLDLTQYAVGVKPGINRNLVYDLEIPLPPLAEQKKIVVKIERAFAKIDAAAQLRTAADTDAAGIMTAALEQVFEGAKKKGWEEKTIEDLAIEIRSGFACSKRNEVPDGVVHLRTHNIDLSGELNLDKIVKIPESFVDKKNLRLKKGDIIFNNTNSAELVGKTIIIRKDLPYAFSNHLTRIRFDQSKVIPEWILSIFQKLWREKYFEDICTRWVGQAGINQTSLSKIKIPLPPLAEQKKIARELDTLSDKVRKLRQLQVEVGDELKELKKAVLREAFE